MNVDISTSPILSLITFLPLVGVIPLLFLGDDESSKRNARRIALYTTLFTFLISLLVWYAFNPATADFQFVEEYPWFGPFKYKMGVDGISMLFVILTTFLMPLCILASWEAINDRVKEYMIAFLVLETLMIGVFCALDLVLFYIFFEAGLIPMFLIIGVWGGPRRVYASYKFFLYTLLGSVLMLLAMMFLYWKVGTTDIPAIIDKVAANPQLIAPEQQWWLWLAFFASFAVKMPMWPVHTWLPDAHVEAPTAGSVILAGILLKMGGYGFLRFSLPMFPVASYELAPLIFTLSVVAIIYTSLVALAQEDVKKLIAYSSVAHMGFVTMGIFTATTQGIDGAIFQMLSHGLVSAALFLCVGIVYDRMHTRLIDDYGGLANRMPIYAFCFMVFTLANVGLPGTSGFVGEFLTLLGAFKVNTWVAFLATTGVILSAAYALWLYRRVIFGELEKPKLMGIADMNLREIVVMAPLVVLTIFFGFYPAPVFDVTAASVKKLVKNYEAAIPKPKSTAGLDRSRTKPVTKTQ
jgi:NADH-quinone oxidoreductase subunit M